jgi:hypothetical protein
MCEEWKMTISLDGRPSPHLNAKRDFPTYSVLRDSPGDIVETVWQLGFCFRRVRPGYVGAASHTNGSFASAFSARGKRLREA